MSNTPYDQADDDPTDELPILLDAELGEDGDASSALPRADNTAEHWALEDAVDADAGRLEPLSPSAEREATQAAGLEMQIAALAERTRELEDHLAEKDRVIGELKHRVGSLNHSPHETSAAERRLATQLAVRDARIAELTTTIEHLRRELTASATQTEQLRTAAETVQQEAASLRSELAARPAGNEAALDLQELLEEKATLAAYIEARRSWWDRARAEQSNLAAQIKALQRELAAGSKRLREAEAFAARESSRAVALRAQLVDSARQVRTLEHELRALRAGGADTAMPSAAAAVEAGTGGAVEPAIAPSSREVAAAPREPQGASLGPDGSGATPAAEAVAELEAEVQYKQQQVSAQLVELRDREQQLRATTGDIERVRAELAAVRNELDASRATVARLERAVIDKNRALETRDARIATLQQELESRFSFDNSDAIELATKPDTPAGGAGRVEAAEEVAAPALLCLTGDAPQRFPLTKQSVTIGRGPQCDLQLLTHFVSREHARITLHADHVLIEDAGSRNGVFVNSVRVDRQMLQQGDLVTIGDTQFRFVESMAH